MTLEFSRTLNYTGRVDLVEGQRLGCDVTGRPYEVAGTVYDEQTDKTRVYLRYAAVTS